MKNRVVLPGDFQARLQRLAAAPWVGTAASLGIAGLLFGWIAFSQHPALVELGLTLRLNLRYVLIVGILLYLSLRLDGWPGRVLSLALVSALFALSLAGLWGTGHTHTTILSGLIPINDAADYYVDALKLSSGLEYSDFSARRPLFAGYLSTLLVLTRHNLMAALAVMAFLSALACYLAMQQVRKTHGAAAAAVTLILLFLFYRTHTGAIMSENIGLPLGVLGFALLWRGADEHKFRWIASGLFLTTLALNARAGAFFILPALLLWAAWKFRDGRRWLSLVHLGLGAALVLGGFAVNFFLFKTLAEPSGVPFANFSYSLYGLAAGGQSWGHIFVVHPEVDIMQEPEKTARIYQLTFELIRTRPALLLTGMVRYWAAFLFSEPWYSAYSYVHLQNPLLNTALHWTLYLLGLAGLARWIWHRGDPFASLLAASLVGLFASVPFAPPSDTYYMRSYAANIVVLALLPAAGLAFLIERFKPGLRQAPEPDRSDLQLTPWYSLLLTAVLIAGPVLVHLTSRLPEAPPASCEADQSSIYIRFDPGTTVNVIGRGSDALAWTLNFNPRAFKRSAHGLSDIELIDVFDKLRPPAALLYTLDYRSRDKVLVILPPGLVPRPGRYAELCGQWSAEPAGLRHRIFTAGTVHLTDP